MTILLNLAVLLSILLFFLMIFFTLSSIAFLLAPFSRSSNTDFPFLTISAIWPLGTLIDPMIYSGKLVLRFLFFFYQLVHFLQGFTCPVSFCVIIWSFLFTAHTISFIFLLTSLAWEAVTLWKLPSYPWFVQFLDCCLWSCRRKAPARSGIGGLDGNNLLSSMWRKTQNFRVKQDETLSMEAQKVLFFFFGYEKQKKR